MITKTIKLIFLCICLALLCSCGFKPLTTDDIPKEKYIERINDTLGTDFVLKDFDKPYYYYDGGFGDYSLIFSGNPKVNIDKFILSLENKGRKYHILDTQKGVINIQDFGYYAILPKDMEIPKDSICYAWRQDPSLVYIICYTKDLKTIYFVEWKW